ncbi:MAG: hypothetical protein ABH834_05005 [Candidatus Altiarchaeota archaeon]
MFSRPDDIEYEVVDDLEDKKRETELLIRESSERIKVLGRMLQRKEINRKEYQSEVDDIQGKIRKAREEIEGIMKSYGIKEKPERSPYELVRGSLLWAAVQLKWLSIPIALYFVMVYFFYSSSCVEVSVLSIYSQRIVNLLHFMEDASPGDYEMVCESVDRVSIGMHPGAYAFFSDDGERTVSLGRGIMDYLDDFNVGGMLVHESCHFMMYDLLGGLDDLTDTEIERPCERMRYRFLYEMGFYKSFDEMVEALAEDRYGKTFTGEQMNQRATLDSLKAHYRRIMGVGGVGNHCSELKFRVQKVDERDFFYLRFINEGKSALHTGLIELKVNGREYPLKSVVLKPGESIVSVGDFELDAQDAYSTKLVGCPD